MTDISMISYLQRKVTEQADYIESLKEGECRFNCRTQWAAFRAGYKIAVGDNWQDWDDDLCRASYEAWKLEQI